MKTSAFCSQRKKLLRGVAVYEEYEERGGARDWKRRNCPDLERIETPGILEKR